MPSRTSKIIAEIGKETRIKSSEQAREMQKKSAQAKLTKRFFREQAMKEFFKDGRSQRAFAQFAMQAAGGDIDSIEVMRKWIGEDDEQKNGNDVQIKVVIENTDEQASLNKWSKKK